MMRRSNKLVWFIAILLVLNFSGLIYTQIKLKQNENQKMQKTISNQKLFLATTADRIDYKIGALADKLDDYASQLNSGSLKLEDLDLKLKNDKAWLNYGVVGLGLADVPKPRNGHKHFHRVYWINHTTQIESQEDSLNYTSNTPENAWFNDVLKSKTKR